MIEYQAEFDDRRTSEFRYLEYQAREGVSKTLYFILLYKPFHINKTFTKWSTVSLSLDLWRFDGQQSQVNTRWCQIVLRLSKFYIRARDTQL